MSHTTVLIYVVIYEYLLIFFFLNYNLPYLLGTTYILFFNRLLEIRCYEIEFWSWSSVNENKLRVFVSKHLTMRITEHCERDYCWTIFVVYFIQLMNIFFLQPTQVHSILAFVQLTFIFRIIFFFNLSPKIVYKTFVLKKQINIISGGGGV